MKRLLFLIILFPFALVAGQLEITGMNPRASSGSLFRCRAAGYLPSAFSGIVRLSIPQSGMQVLQIKLTGSAGKKITVTGFSGMREEKLAEMTMNSEGVAKYSGDYQGFLLLEIENKGLFPVILEQNQVTFSLDEKGFPRFTDRENSRLYEALNRKNTSEHKRMTLRENLSYFRENDPYYPVLKRKQKELDSVKVNYESGIMNEKSSLAGLIMQGRQVIESTYGIRTKEQLDERKKAMLDFLSANYKQLYHSDIFRQTAFQYAMMNEYVAKSREEHYKYVIADIKDWIDRLNGKLTPEEITGFFLEMAVGRRMISLGSVILENYAGYTGCTVKNVPATKHGVFPDITLHLWKSKETGMPLSKLGEGKKLLIFYDEDCVFCLPAHVRMMNLLENNAQSINVITVFTGKKSPVELEELELPRQFNYWYYDDPAAGATLSSNLGIKKYPAFVILDPAVREPLLFYTGDEAVRALVKPQK